jgi:hypothetical protein
MPMKIHELFLNQRASAFKILYEAATAAGEIIFPQAEVLRPGSTGGVLSVWYDRTGNGDWVIGCNLEIGTIGGPADRSTFGSAELYDHHAAVKNTSMLCAILKNRTDKKNRPIITSSQLADESPIDPFKKRYGGGIICCEGRVAISFSGLPWKLEEVMAADVAYRVDRSITASRVAEIIVLSVNEHLVTHSEEYFKFAA